MRALTSRLLELAPRLADRELLVIAATAPTLDVRRLLAAPVRGAERLVWDEDSLLGAGDRASGSGLGVPDAWSVAGRGEALRVDASGPARLAELEAAARAALGALVIDDGGLEIGPPRLFGGLSFRPAGRHPAPWTAFGDASFVMPRWLCARRGPHAFVRLAVRGAELCDPALLGEVDAVVAHLERPSSPEGMDAAPWEARALLEPMSPRAWDELVADALARIRSRELEKVVAARQTYVSAPEPIDVARVLRRMRGAQPGCVEFALTRGDAVFLGATPERLVVKRGLGLETEALAGTRRCGGPGDDGPAELLASDKDRREQDAVVRGIRAALEPLCESIALPAAPRVRTLRSVHHLSTPISGRLRRPAHVLEVLGALHPTPAVSGLPRQRAIDWISAHEPSPRGWYAAPVGWFDSAGDGAFAVAIRSALVQRERAWLYAGAGIVEGSDAGLEYAETSLKQAAMLAALGVPA